MIKEAEDIAPNKTCQVYLAQGLADSRHLLLFTLCASLAHLGRLGAKSVNE